MSKMVSNFFITLQKRSHIATDSHGGPTECIHGKISAMEDFRRIPDLKTCITVLNEFHAKTVPNVSIFLHVCQKVLKCY